jgi:tetratricopeptide (TPR) repeat protein
LQRLEAERDNLRIALAWALNGGDMELGVRLAIALWQFWEQGYGNEGRTWLNRASAGSSGVVHTLRARVLLRGGWFGSGDQATAMVEESLALFQELGDRSNMAWAMAKMGHHAWLRSEYAQAITYLEQSLAMFRELGDSRGMASALQLLGDATRDCSETQRAITCLQESVARFRELGDLGGLAFALTGLGDAYYNQDDLVAAHTCFQESAARFQEIGNRYGLPWALLTLGKVAYAQHQFAQAQLLLEDTVARFRSLGHRTALAWSLHHLSATLLMQNADREAQVLLREALELQYIERNKRLIVESLERCVMLQVRQHAFIPAARIGGAAEGLHEREHLPLARADKTIYEREIAALRAQMDTPTLADAWAAGRTLTWQQAADESLAWLEAMGAAEIR